MSLRARDVVCTFALFTALSACKSTPTGGNAQEAAASLVLSVMSVSAGARVLPGGTLAVSVVVKNGGNTTWNAGDVQLVWQGDAGFTSATLTTTQQIKPNSQGTFVGQLRAPTQIGRFALAWQATACG